jgi:penicillin-binding protein 2X
MYGWTKENVEIFADWMGIKVNYKGDSNGTVTNQSVEIGTEVEGIKKITITIGEEE